MFSVLVVLMKMSGWIFGGVVVNIITFKLLQIRDYETLKWPKKVLFKNGR